MIFNSPQYFLNFIELQLNFIEFKLNYVIEYCYNRLAIFKSNAQNIVPLAIIWFLNLGTELQ